MDKNKNILFGVIIVAALGGAAYFWVSSSGDTPAPGRPSRPTVASGTPAEDTSRGADSVDRSGGDVALLDEDRPDVEEDAVSEGDEQQASADKAKRRPKRKRPKRKSSGTGDDDEEEEEAEEQSRTFRPVRKAP